MSTARVLTALLLCVLTACGGGSSSGGGGGGAGGAGAAPQPPADPGPSAAQELRDDIANLGFAEALELATRRIALRDPEDVIADGLAHEYQLEGVALTDISFDYRRATLDMWQVLQDYLQQLDPQALADGERLSYEILAWQAAAQLAGREFLHFEFQGTYMLFSVPSRTERFFSDLHPRATEDDAREYLQRLQGVGDKIRQLARNMREQQELGVIEPAITLRVALSARGRVGNSVVDSSPYYGPMVAAVAALPGVSEDFVAQFREDAARIVRDEINPAYGELMDLMESQLELAPRDIGVGQYANGEAYYRERLRYHTTTELGPEAIHQLGLEELARIQAALRQRFGQLGYPEGESLTDSFARVVRDGGTVAAQDAVATYEAIIADADSRMDSLFQRRPAAAVRVIGGDNGGF